MVRHYTAKVFLGWEACCFATEDTKERKGGKQAPADEKVRKWNTWCQRGGAVGQFDGAFSLAGSALLCDLGGSKLLTAEIAKVNAEFAKKT